MDSEDLVEGKTKNLQKAIDVQELSDAFICFITAANVDANFERAQRNMKGVKWYTSENFDVLDVIKADKVVITKEGLKELTLNIFKSEYIIYKFPHMKQIDTKDPNKVEE